MTSRRVPKVINVREGFVPSTLGTGGGTTGTPVAQNVMVCMANTILIGTSVPVAGFEFLRYDSIVFAISGITANSVITYELTMTDVNGVTLATTGQRLVTAVNGRVAGIWTHGIAEINDSFVFVNMSSNALGDPRWNMAMIRGVDTNVPPGFRASLSATSLASSTTTFSPFTSISTSSVNLPANRLILVGVSNRGYFHGLFGIETNVGPPPTVTGCGQNWEVVSTQPIGGASDSRWTVYRAYTTAAVSGTITASLTPLYGTPDMHIHVVEVDGTPASTTNGADLILQARQTGTNLFQYGTEFIWWSYLPFSAFAAPVNGVIAFGYNPGTADPIIAGVPHEATDHFVTLAEVHVPYNASIVFFRNSPPIPQYNGDLFVAMHGNGGSPPVGLIAFEIVGL